jgi:phenylacetate-CoA ligase
MDFFAPVVKNVIYPLWAFKNRDLVLRRLKEVEKYQYLPPGKLKELQIKRLKKLLTHAYNNCPYYKQKFNEFGITPQKIQDFDDLTKIPPLSKYDIQFFHNEIVARNFTSEQLIADRTGGSTGKPLHFYRDKEKDCYMRAIRIRHNRWAGWDIGDKMASIWGHRDNSYSIKDRIYNSFLTRSIVLDSTSMTHQKLWHFIDKFKAYKPRGILAYANSMYFFAQFVKENNIQSIYPHYIITSAEMLHKYQRELIEGTFSTQVFDRYGSREVGLIASECEEHTGLHINADSLILEFIKNGKPVETGEAEIYITDLFNYGMPFIRYKIEDMGMPYTKGTCSCGRTLPLMKMVAGRVTDFLRCMDGRLVSGAPLTLYLAAEVKGIQQVQIIQEKKDLILLRIVRRPEFDEESIKFLNFKLPEFFGADMNFNFEYAESIKPERSGKYRFSICRIEK